ncbi:hypothetical protein GCM10023194_16090 [Planotetraspora phitsanulokensis]|uniref:Lipoprotein n=1 Tax=Planotetraspora phitsanulokensis TaxID=575192 RepID=A0A8J3XFB9_9ACTN|nr:hypothetical protein [Planotetraspora phitsanulokensis]GII38779.1 hypothetical protein Pph01_37820 [Planotetraspora phitsanulokensis]
MRIIHTALVCGLIAMTGACGTEDVIHARARSTAETARMRAALATMDDLPAGFSDRARDRWQPPFRPKKRACRVLFDAVAGKPPQDGLGGTAAVTYQGDGIGELAGVGLAVYLGDQAADHLEELREAMGECVTAQSGGAGQRDRLVVSEFPIEDVGDDVEARRLTGRVGGYPYEMHLVVANVNHTLVALVHAGLAPPDALRTEELVRSLVREVGSLDP